MGRTRWTVIGIVFFSLLAFSNAVADLADLGIVPQPQKWQKLGGTFHISNPAYILLESHSIQPNARAVQELTRALSNELHLSATVQTADQPQTGALFLAKLDSPTAKGLLKKWGVQWKPEMEAEGYVLRIAPDEVTILAASDHGLFYGTVTFIQLLQKFSSFNLPCVQIVDWPAMKFRGISDDMARGQVLTLEEMKRVVRFSALFKMNTYMPYFEDLFTSKTYPSIVKTRGRLSPWEIRELQDYARSYFVQIIPIFEMLGHCENILIQPKFRHLAEFPGAASLNPTSTAVDTFLQNLISDLAPQFDSPYFHAGLDESWDVGKGMSRIYVERYNTAVVHAEHYKKLYATLKKHGKKMIMYGDIILRNPEILTQLPPDILIMDWHYGAAVDFPSVEFFHRAGRPFLVSPGVSDWRRIFPDLTTAFVNIRYLTQKGAAYGALGSIVSTWGDYGGANFKELDWPGFAFTAACTWNPTDVNLERFRKNFVRQFYGCDCPEILAVTDLLAKTASGIQYRDIWRHPFAPTDASSGILLRKSVACQNTESEVLRLLPKIQKKVKRNAGQLDYLTEIARLTGWYGRKLETVLWWNHLLHEHILPKDRAPFRPIAVARFREMASQIASLGRDYQALWLRANKSANLSLILRQFKREELFWKIKADQVSHGLDNENPALPSQFIFFPTASDDQATVPLAYFRKVFTISKNPKKALLQVINYGVTENYLNGKRLGESIARYANAMYVDSQRVQVYDVTNRIQRGKNVLAFKARSFDPRGKAGVNVFLWLLYKDGHTTRILSDKYWKSADRPFKNWLKRDFDDSSWYHCIVRPFRRFIPRPYFRYNLPSWVE